MLLGSRWFSRYVTADRWFLHRMYPRSSEWKRTGRASVIPSKPLFPSTCAKKGRVADMLDWSRPADEEDPIFLRERKVCQAFSDHQDAYRTAM